jgi:Trypsin
MANETQLLLALDILTEGSGAEVPEAMRPEAMKVHKTARPWTAGKGIQGLGIAEKITDGVRLRELVLKVYVDRKKPRARVKNLVPRRLNLPGLPAEVPTDVEEIGVVKVEPNTTRVRPAIPGFSVGHVKITAGTFGCLVRKQGDPKTLYVLSNSHVLADEGTGAKGDLILQPGKLDGGTVAKDVLAELSEWVAFQFSTAGYPNLVDTAIARVKSAKSVTSAIRLIGVPKGVSRTVQRDMQVQKTGRTTDYTVGIIKDINYRTALTYKKPGGGSGRVGFRDQVLCTRYTAGGDSGSAVLNMQREVVGLHFAGSDSSSIFNRIGHVLDALNIDIVTSKI